MSFYRPIIQVGLYTSLNSNSQYYFISNVLCCITIFDVFGSFSFVDFFIINQVLQISLNNLFFNRRWFYAIKNMDLQP
jgi:hypothetical protein